MGDIATILPGHFGITGTRATKERGYFICKTSNGMVKIHKTNERHQNIKQMHIVLNQIHDAGFTAIDTTSLSVHGLPYVHLGRETYVMCKYVQGQELDLENQDDVLLTMGNIARFHNSAKGFTICQETKNLAVSPALEDIFSSNIDFLTKTQRQINKGSRMTDFDFLFIKNSNRYIQYAQESARILDQANYRQLHENAVAKRHICHNNLKEENLPIANGLPHIINFADMSIGEQLTDLASFLHRYARCSSRTIPLAQLVEAYNKVSPLPPCAPQVIDAYLMHPWQFVKIARQYYNKKRGWTPAAVMSRLSALLEVQDSYDTYTLAFSQP